MLLLDIAVGGVVPLTARELRILKSNHSYLVQFLKIDDDNVLTRMCENGCLTKDQASYLAAKSLSAERNRKLMDIMKRRSLRCYRQFIGCLQQSRYTCNINAAQILEHGEGMTPTHFTSFEFNSFVSRTQAVQDFKIVSSLNTWFINVIFRFPVS